jgi:fatty-acid desaturase
MLRKLLNKLKNPHIQHIHVPAHVLGFMALTYALTHLSWWSIWGFALFNLWLSCFGMSVGFHRYFSHKAFKVNRWWYHVMLWGGTFAGQGSVVFWVALHRIHHPNSDRNLADIHSPKFKGFWNAYMGWIFTLNPLEVPLSKAADVIRCPWARFTHRNYDRVMWTYWVVLLTTAALIPVTRPFIAGALIAGMWSIHQEALINSVCHDHRFGTAPYADKTNDGSRNVPALHYITWGQSLHNTHHAFAGSPNFGTPEHPDMGYRFIRLIAVEDQPSRKHTATHYC